MNFDIPTAAAEKEPLIPSLEEVKAQIERLGCKEGLEVRMLEDEKGVYLYEVVTLDEKGDATLYMYRRAGIYKETRAAETEIEVAYFNGPLEDDMCVGGENLSEYDDLTGTWTDAR